MPRAKKESGAQPLVTRGQKQCPECGAYVPARWFAKHVAKHGSAIQPLRAANKAGAAAKASTPQGQDRPKCPHCGKTFGKLSGLSSHLHFVHPGKSAPMAKKSAGAPAKKGGAFKCAQCGQTFARPSSLSTHIRYRHPAQPRTVKTQLQAFASKVETAVASITGPNASAQDHLKNALQELTLRHQGIDEQLSHMEALHAERESIAKQIDAVNAALQAFEG